MLSILFFAACGGGVEPPVQEYVALSPVEQAHRISMALRGLRASDAEVQMIQDDPDAVVELAEAYVQGEAFGETIRDLYAEVFRVRAVDSNLPELGVLEGSTRMERNRILHEEPLALIEHIVNTDQPLTEMVQANWTILDEWGAKAWASHSGYDAAQGGEQVVQFTDGRPGGGVLLTNAMLARWGSAGANAHRGRADMVSDTLLCEPFGGRDLPLSGDVDLSDESAVESAIWSEPVCVACHQSLDPIAAHYWYTRARVTNFLIRQSYEVGCPSALALCFPMEMYSSTIPRDAEDQGLRAEGYFGQETGDFEGLGRAIAADPRFAQCQAKRFASYLTQRDLGAIPFEEMVSLQTQLVESGFDAKALAVHIVTSPAFLAKDIVGGEGADALPGLQVLRPEQLHRTVLDLTGFSYDMEVTDQGLGLIPLLRDDLVGFRAMSGGVDGFRVATPTHTATPNRLLTLATVAEEAAAALVVLEMTKNARSRKLLFELSDYSESSLRAQLVVLHRRLLREEVAQDAPEIDEGFALWEAALAASADEEDALKTLLAAYLQAPEMLYY